jgi:hypothetical protein
MIPRQDWSKHAKLLQGRLLEEYLVLAEIKEI